jgi:hypothetical protein
VRRPLSITVIRTAEGWHVQHGGETFLIEAELPSTAALLVLAAVGLLVTNPGLHAPAQYPLVFVLVLGSLALRWLTSEVAATGQPPAGPATRGASAAPS